MDKRSPLRLVYNLMLVAVVVISVAATGLISVKGYYADRMPEMHSDEQIINQVKQKYLNFKFGDNDIWNISKNPGENNKSFSVDISIDQVTELCKKNYKVQIL